MELGKRWLFLIGNGAEIRPLEKGRKSPEKKDLAWNRFFFLSYSCCHICCIGSHIHGRQVMLLIYLNDAILLCRTSDHLGAFGSLF